MVKHKTFRITESPMVEFRKRFYVGCHPGYSVNNAGAYMGVEVDGAKSITNGGWWFESLAAAREAFHKFRNDIEADLSDHWLVIVEVQPRHEGQDRLVHSVFDEPNAGAYRSPVVPTYEWRGVDSPHETQPEHPDTGTW